MRSTDLRCEYLVNPLGIDEKKPRLSWRTESNLRGQRQTAYHLLVASSREKLQKNVGDLWDTGRVESGQSVHVVYGGKPLDSRTRCYWKVRVQDREGSPSAWSRPAMWSMGLLDQAEWKAEWIGWDAVPRSQGDVTESVDKPLSLGAASWIWYPLGSPARSAPVGDCYFRRSFELPQGRKVKSAVARFTADNSIALMLNGRRVLRGDNFNVCETADVTAQLVPGLNVMAVRAANVGDAPNPAGMIGVLRITFESGPPLTILTDAKWKASDEKQDKDWLAPEYADTRWKTARVLGRYGMGPWGKVGSGAAQKAKKKRYLPCPHLRKDFNISGQVSRASLYVTAQGFAEMHVNGKRVGDEFFMPGWTDYRKRIYYRTYDVTGMLKPGANTIAGILGDGWFRGNISIKGQNQYGDKIRLLTQLHIDYADGRAETITSDPTWKASFGPILESDMQAGEVHDARRELRGWDSPGFDDSGWAPVDIGSGIKPLLQSYPGVPVRRTQELPTVKLTKPQPDTHVFDLGQNFSGWIRLKVTGKAGDRVVMRFGEMLNADGTVYTANLRSARATDTYILKGGREEVWEPRFTFHGFRYVQLTGVPGRPTPDMVTGIVIHSDAPLTSSFACSNPMLNQLHSNIVWGQRSNYLEIPTDCPQRDERLGWTGDTQVFIRSGCYHQDVASFFTKWMVDLVDTQNGAGVFGNQAPVFHGHGSPAWADAGIICPWTIYKVYGDTRLIDRHYGAMARFIDAYGKKGLKGPGGGFGDWLAIGSKTPKELISAAYFGYSTSLMAEMAEALGKAEDAKKYKALFEAIRTEFQKSFVKPDGTIAGNSQTAYCLALRFKLLTDAQREQAAARLVERIEAKNYHLSVGFVGVPILLPTLTEIGRSDLAYRLIQNKTYPSWGYSIEQGATTIWERWNSYTREKGFGDVGMNSFNHYAYGACSEWMFRSMLGIETDGVGFKTIIMKPEFGEGITWAEGHYDSIYGRIKSDWKVGDGTFQWVVTVPANTTATVHIPAGNVADITESGRPIKDAKGVTFLRMAEDRAVFGVDSGTYEFVAKSGE
jgi:alpha-L-rhamnosidase